MMNAEKPMASSLKECDAMIQAAEENKLGYCAKSFSHSDDENKAHFGAGFNCGQSFTRR